MRDEDKTREQLLEDLRLLRGQLEQGDERRRRAETTLRETQEFLARLLDHTPAPIYVTDRDGRRRVVNRAWEALWQKPRADVVGRTVEELYPPGLARQFLEENRRVLETAAPLAFEEAIDTPGGRRHLITVKFPLRDAADQPEAVGGISFDVTERKQAEAQLRDSSERVRSLSRRLLTLQEEERRHLARELHDGVCQVLTCLAFALEGGAPAASEAGARLGEARALLGQALTQIRQLAFDLRPALLDHFGLLPALRRLIERYTETTGVRVSFNQAGLEARFAPELETAGYRIVQEALHNVARHARVAEAAVRLWVHADALEVQVEDQGVGFDVEAVLAAGASGGLAGVRERAQLLGGQLVLESAPGAGTHLLARLPLRGSTGEKIDEHFHRLGR